MLPGSQSYVFREQNVGPSTRRPWATSGSCSSRSSEEVLGHGLGGLDLDRHSPAASVDHQVDLVELSKEATRIRERVLPDVGLLQRSIGVTRERLPDQGGLPGLTRTRERHHRILPDHVLRAVSRARGIMMGQGSCRLNFRCSIYKTGGIAASSASIRRRIKACPARMS